MAGSKLLTDRAHRDGSPVQRNRSDIKKTFDVAKVNADDKVRISDNRGLEGNKSSGTQMKMLLAKEMTKETEPRKKPPNVSVVARLMGLEDDIPAQPVLPFNTSDSKATQSFAYTVETNMVLLQQENHHNRKPASCDLHVSSVDTVEYKDVYELCQQLTRNSRFQENRNNKSMDVVRQKFMEAKRLATDEKLLHSKEFQEALEVLSSNRDVFLKFLEEPDSIFSKQPNGLPTMPPIPQTKRITVLKPVKSAESKEGRQDKQQQVSESGWKRRKQHQRSLSMEERFSQPTRIVVLKPSPGKSNEMKGKLTPRATATQLIHPTDFYGGLEDNDTVIGSREVFHDSTQHLREGCHRRDESLLSSAYSNGYGGDESSLSRSEEEGGSFSDLEIVSPVSRHSWDFINRFSSYSASSLGRASYLSESSVIWEAKKRLSERWAMVTHDDVGQEQVRVPRSSSTLGQMLSLKEVKKKEDVSNGLVVSSSRSCDAENELRTKPACLSIDRKSDGYGESSPQNLSRSKSVPVSLSMYGNTCLNAQGTNFQDSKVTKDAEIAKPNRGKSFFKGKVSNFFSRNKKSGKEKLSRPSGVSDKRVKVPCDGGTSLTKMDHGVVLCERVATSEVTNGKVALSSLNIGPKSSISIGESRPSNYPIGNLGKLASNEGTRITCDQPSPASVLNAWFEDINNTEPESCSSSSTGNLQALSKCSAIESVARSLSWDDTYLEGPLLRTPRFSTLSIVENDECCTLVQNLISSLGLDSGRANMVFSGWYLPNCPLNPSLLDDFLDRKEEAAKSRERRSNQRLLFDSVNAAVLEIGENTLVSAFPCTKARAAAPRDLHCDLVMQVWSFVKDWFNGDSNFLAAEINYTSLVVETAVKSDVEGRGWCKLMRSEVDEIIEDIGGKVLEELVGEALLDFCI